MGLFKKKNQWEKELEKLPPYQEKEKVKGFRKLRREKPWLVRGLWVSLAVSVLFSSFYGVFNARASKYEISPIENLDNIAWLYQNCYLLYRDLHNAQTEEELDYADVYLETGEEYSWILDEKQLEEYMTLLQVLEELGQGTESVTESTNKDWLQEALEKGNVTDEQLQERVSQGILDGDILNAYRDSTCSYNISMGGCDAIRDERNVFEYYFQNLEDGFPNLNSSYDYIIEDTATGKIVTNMSMDDRNQSSDSTYFLLEFVFDDSGNVTVGDTVRGRDESQVRKYANEVVREGSLQALLNNGMKEFQKYGKLRTPAGCTVTFSVTEAAWADKKEGFYIGRAAQGGYDNGTGSYYVTYRYNDSLNSYWMSGLNNVILCCMLAMVLAGMYFPLPGRKKPWMEERICAVSMELLVCIVCVLCAFMESVMSMVAYIAGGEAGGAFTSYLGWVEPDAVNFLITVLNLSVLTLFYSGCWYVGICARAVRELGLKRYITQRSLIYRFFPFMKRNAVRIYDSVAHMDLTRNSNRTIIRLLAVNALILLVISSFWYGGFAITAVYSFVLYVILRKYISELQKRYRILLKAVDEIAKGNLNVVIQEDLGVFEPFREQVFKIQDGLRKAVDTEVKSQRMKVELVTNMSHDLKTPLTAIITYINLLKEKDVTEEQRREYLATLERKSLRLKSLIEDLFEFSKASSQNITLNIMDVDIMNLVKQVAFEMSDKLGESELDVRMNLTDEKVILPLDSQKTYRIYENLFGNISKYALRGTRVYVNGFRIDDTVVITLKNISAQEITVDSSELTERFVRGDASRNTEGSGLGLAIAKSFMELQGGHLDLEVDGDLFKVTTTWFVEREAILPRDAAGSQEGKNGSGRE